NSFGSARTGSSLRPSLELALGLVLAQRWHGYWDIEGSRACTHSSLTCVGREGTNRPVSLASSAPEHVAQHSGSCSSSCGRNCLNKVGCHFLIGAGVAVAVWYHVIADHPNAARKLGGCQWGHGAGEAVNVLLPQAL